MSWSKGIAEWQDGNTLYLSVVFTWQLTEAYSRAVFARSMGMKVIAGGAALFHPRMRKELQDVAEIGLHYPDAIRYHNPDATIASRGCPVGCWFCIVPAMEGRQFTLLPDFPVRPVLCDQNLSGLPVEYQEHIIKRYQDEGVPLLDANSGFEPLTFDDDCFNRWKAINKGVWRFAYDEMKEREQVLRVMKMMRGVNQNLKRVYVLIGNEPFDVCMDRIKEAIANDCLPHVQPFMKLTTLRRIPHARFDWTVQKLRDVARWANRKLWKQCEFKDYQRSYKKPTDRLKYDAVQGLFI